MMNCNLIILVLFEDWPDRVEHIQSNSILLIFRSLPPMAKRYILQMLYIDTAITAKSLEEWLLPEGFSKHKVAIDRLLQLRVFLEVNDRYDALYASSWDICFYCSISSFMLLKAKMFNTRCLCLKSLSGKCFTAFVWSPVVQDVNWLVFDSKI